MSINTKWYITIYYDISKPRSQTQIISFVYLYYDETFEFTSKV